MKIIVTLILSLLLSVFIFYQITNDGLIIKIFGIGILEIESGSMQPELDIGDIIIIKESNSYEINDIITYSVDNQYLITHRILEKKGNNYVTKGDSNNTKDDKIVTKENIEGKMIVKSKLLKWIYNYWIVIVLVIFLILIIL